MTNTQDLLRELSQTLDAESLLRDLCGVGEIYEIGEELSHSCKLPFGLHKNGDQNPSASLNRETLLFNCFTCGGGSLFWLVENVLDISFNQAIQRVRDYTVVDSASYEKFIDRLKNRLRGDVPVGRVDIPVYSDKIIEQWIGISSYLLKRGVSHQVQEEMKIGTNESIEEWVREGDRYQKLILSRVVIPHYYREKLVGWQGRKLSSDPRPPKYKNSKGFPKAWTLYNFDNLDSKEELIVVESPMSVLKLKSLGYTNVVSTFGASISDYQISLLGSFGNVCIWMDGDHAGRRATSRLVSKLNKTNNLSIIDIEGEDPASVPSPEECFSKDRKNILEWKLSPKGYLGQPTRQN